MKKQLFMLVVFLTVPFVLFAEIIELDHLGQTPGGSAFNLTYDAPSERLFVGCGSSIWVYDVSDIENAELIAMRPFRGMINEMILDGDVLFAAATHDGLWALDATSPTLEPLHSLSLPPEKAAYDICMTADTIYLADYSEVVVLTFDPIAGFAEIGSISQLFCMPMTVALRDGYLAVGWWKVIPLCGVIDVYRTDDLSAPITSWSNVNLYNLQDLQFADMRDDIIYICGGTNNLGLTGQFYALQLDTDTLIEVDHYTIGGVPGLANAQILNMDSRNDTLFLATTAGVRGLESDVPVLDATGLPEDTMEVIGHIRPGLWHFDVALFGDEPFMAIASEWYGVWINDITDLTPLDTLAVLPTGGWCQRCYVHGDTVWACMRGYGLVAWDVDDLYFDVGFLPNSDLLTIRGAFVFDCAFVDDSLLFLARASNKIAVYNLRPWHSGDEPLLIANFGSSGLKSVDCIAFAQTDMGPRIIAGIYTGEIELYDPYAYPDYPLISSTKIGGSPTELIVCGDTLFVGANIDTQRSIAAYIISDDTLHLIARCAAPNTVGRIAKEGDILASALESVGFAWYRFEGDTIVELGRKSGVYANDVTFHDGLLYVAEKYKGLGIYDISTSDSAELIATSIGSGGYQSMFGSTSITVGDDGRSYLCDFNSGIFVIESFDTTGITTELSPARPYKITINAYPNPFNSSVILALHGVGATYRSPGQIAVEIYDISGRLVGNLPLSSAETAGETGSFREDPTPVIWQPKNLPSGVYLARAKIGYEMISKRIIYLK